MRAASSLPNKPRLGNECNGCGLCCIIEPCAVAIAHLGVTEGPCPALEWEDGRSWCGMVRNPSRHLGLRFDGDELLSPMFRLALGVGMGCDAADDEQEELAAAAVARERIAVLHESSIQDERAAMRESTDGPERTRSEPSTERAP